MKRNITYIGGALAVIFFLSPLSAQAQWSGPSQAPTGGNTSAPINVSTSAQVKNGGLSVNAFTAWLDSYFAGNVGVGIVSPQSKLQVIGTFFVNNTSDATGGLYYGGASNGLIIGNYASTPWPGINGLYVTGPTILGGTVKVTSGTPGAGKVLTSDATGLATWTTPSVGGTVTSITAGTGLSGGTITTSGTISADTAYLQRRVSGTCASGYAIQTIASDGTVTCQQGPTGPQGPAGSTGATGATGSTGATGPAGPGTTKFNTTVGAVSATSGCYPPTGSPCGNWQVTAGHRYCWPQGYATGMVVEQSGNNSWDSAEVACWY
jgi:hypothetical protein